MSTYKETVKGETLSPISEESESHSQDGINSDYAPEDATKVAVNTCLIDQTDGQVAYGSYCVGGLQNPRQRALTRHMKYVHMNIGKDLENYMDSLSHDAFTQSGTLLHRLNVIVRLLIIKEFPTSNSTARPSIQKSFHLILFSIDNGVTRTTI